jgi:predicted RNA polymerase sigma factor
MHGTPYGTRTDVPRAAPRLWRALAAYAGDRDIADDALAEAFAHAAARWPALRMPDRWVWKAAFWIAAGELKDRGRQPVADVLEDVDAGEAVDARDAA